MVCHQLVRGLSDPVIQEQMLTHGADQKDLYIATTLKFVEAKEEVSALQIFYHLPGGCIK